MDGPGLRPTSGVGVDGFAANIKCIACCRTRQLIGKNNLHRNTSQKCQRQALTFLRIWGGGWRLRQLLRNGRHSAGDALPLLDHWAARLLQTATYLVNDGDKTVNNVLQTNDVCCGALEATDCRFDSPEASAGTGSSAAAGWVVAAAETRPAASAVAAACVAAVAAESSATSLAPALKCHRAAPATIDRKCRKLRVSTRQYQETSEE